MEERDVAEESERPAKIRKRSHPSGAEQPAALRRNSSSDIDSQEIIVSDEGSSRDGESKQAEPPTVAQDSTPGPENGTTTTTKPLSKNQLKKQKRRDEWEAGRDFRKAKRKQKTKEKRQRKKLANEEAALATANGTSPPDPTLFQPRKPRNPVQLPITLIIDCGFDELMMEKEYISLGSQLTRAYSDNSRSTLQAHLAVSGWGGRLKERFDTVLSGHYKQWRGMTFHEEGFVEVAEQAKGWMEGADGAKGRNPLKGAFARYAVEAEAANKEDPNEQTGVDSEASGEVNGHEESTSTAGPSVPLPPRETIYLTADSPHTLTHLHPYSTYIIGGIVDKNRHKSLCYNLALSKGIKTAKLPIGEFMQLQSRSVLATNHVVEIMLRWLENGGDWGAALQQVMPKRKGAVLTKKEKRAKRKEHGSTGPAKAGGAVEDDESNDEGADEDKGDVVNGDSDAEDDEQETEEADAHDRAGSHAAAGGVESAASITVDQPEGTIDRTFSSSS
ncbi:tRNA (guanine(9)-N1)-methyltransferase [Cyphellophora attinorum]|uniref:tRNA (guanine(9)-N1)-methyltransferase n=1 Tax=Cyphellophora attinorum TaxID=1664694 RepID=A0A0N1I081_9EURO|nr:tRNA (guanine(9)-N1)-methyltransferase [Phialophora attinorum]KPI44774.1 tRNA (guanine(9)-N1)-methyltransferase [Phialophora attinorum]